MQNSDVEVRKSFNEDNTSKIRIFFGENNENFYMNKRHGTNRINTTKYNTFTFLPKSILFQFKKAANIYFLIVSILTSMEFSPKEPSSMIITFAFVLFATIVKEFIEDFNRYKQDKIANNKKVLKYSKGGSWEKIECCNLITGDIIKVMKEEEFTSDCIIIKSSSEGGSCFIDTKNLDGESYLKEKCAIEEFKDTPEENFKYISGELDYDKPNEIITNWEGILSIGENTIYTNIRNMILKGCSLKNTDFVIGIVVYVGSNTKIMKNSKKPRIKISRILLTMNNMLYTLFIFDIFVCIIFAAFSNSFESPMDLYGIFEDAKKSNMDSSFFNYLILFLTFFVGYSQLIPISLYVALEVMRIIQSLLIYYDNDIFDEVLNKPTISKTTDLIEELGQVEFIFSDKTGTLTQNSMILKKCYVNKKIYGILKEKPEKELFTINGDVTPSKKILSNCDSDKRDKECLLEFFNLLALCHSVFPEKTDKGIVYQGSSPDDVALVQGAAQMGIEFSSKDFNELRLHNRLINSESVWELIAELPFDSNRKRMSVIVKDKSTGEIILFSKGADNVMLSEDRVNLNEDEYEEIDNVLNLFSKEGLRILVMAMRYIEEGEFEDWHNRLNEARNQGAKLTRLFEEMESDMHFVGCSAVEDKLQEGVPETIHSLLSCNIRVWVLTGDKQDTALEIAKSCMLINENMHVLVLATEPSSVEEKLKEVMRELNLDILDEIQNFGLDDISKFVREHLDKDLSVIIDGSTLEIVLNNYELSRIFFYISIAAKSVVCCRVSPKQKAKVINLTKQYGPWVTLSIGDGANDVPMIMESHIGIGIMGKEGTQAVMSSDYAICKFKFLEKLLLIHGRNGYMKISKFICFYFYKNILLVLTEVYFAIYNRFSGQIFFADYLGTMFNAFFTSWPCMFTFLLERDHDLKICKRFPILYKAGQINYYFNIKQFWLYVFAAIFHSFFAFYIPMFSMSSVNNSNGLIFNHWEISTISFSLVIYIVTLKLFIMSNYWTLINIITSFLSVIFYYIVLFVLSSKSFSYQFQNELNGVAWYLFCNYKSSMIMIFSPFIALLPDFIVKQINYNLFPTPTEYIENYKGTTEFLKINNSESRFIKNISNMQSELAQKIELVSITENKKLFEKKSNQRLSGKNIYDIKNRHGPSSISSSYNSENSKIPLIDSHKKDRLNYINQSHKRIDEIQSEEIRSEVNLNENENESNSNINSNSNSNENENDHDNDHESGNTEKSAEKDFLASFKSIRVKNTSFEQIKDTRKRLSLNNQILNFDFLRKNSHPGNNMNKNENDNNIYYIQKSEKENENFSDG